MNYDINEATELFYIGESQTSKVAYLEYEIDDEVLIIDIVKVNSSLRGQGIAALLVKHAVEFARKHNLMVDPACSYAKNQFKKNSEYSDVLYQKG
jgi:predicted GNAT family acetyltransferase